MRTWPAVLALVFLALGYAGCGSPGDPLPPLLNIPARTTDFTAAERGQELVLSWTLPLLTTEGYPLREVARVVVWEKEIAAGAPEGASFSTGAQELPVLDSPLDGYLPGQPIAIRLPLGIPPGKRIGVAVESYNRRGRSAGPSNIVVFETAAAPDPPASLTTTANANSIHAVWAKVEGAAGYHVYRSTLDRPEFKLLATVVENTFNDPDFQWETPQSYFVRAFVPAGSGTVESADSPLAAIVPRDTFPPSAPSRLQAVIGESAVELSWDPSPEADTAGYFVYRKQDAGEPVRLNAAPVAAPTYSDRSVAKGQRYSYAVSAVDGKGNESAPSAALEAMVP